MSRGGRSAGGDRIAFAAVDAVLDADVIVIGAGVAGLSAALGCAPAKVHLITKTPFGGGGASQWAQGGIAVAVGGQDSPELHASDTVAVGVGLNDSDAVAVLTREGPARVRELIELGTRFDRDSDGSLLLGREPAHATRRILHANGDATGAEMVRALSSAAARRSDSIEIHAETMALDLVRDGGRVGGVVALHPDGRVILHRAPAVVLATGGAGRLYKHTTNPPEATADGIALAARVGAVLEDLEFVQFHPTALASGDDPNPLLTEALRGEGAVLIDEDGRRFMLDVHPDAELAPRDIVARAIWRHASAGHRTMLDARAAVGERFPTRFPTVFASCMQRGMDPRHMPIPVSPAAHYYMGGVATDTRGRTSVTGLWACGEVANSGVHGANRLASNSLLEALVYGARVAGDVGAAAKDGTPGVVATTRRLRGTPGLSVPVVARLRQLMWDNVGLVRTGSGLEAAIAELDALAIQHRGLLVPEAANLLLVARMVARTALDRPESRGAHYREDFPSTDLAWQRHLRVELSEHGEINVKGLPSLVPAA